MHSKSGPRRRHSAELKAKVLGACDEPGASISGVALAHGLNANLVRKWRSGRGVRLAGVTVEPPTASKAPKRPVSTALPLLGTNPEFVAIEMPRPLKPKAGAATEHAGAWPSAEPLIHVELRRGPLHLNVRWPSSAADDCTAWLRELSSGMLK
jgi:transposase